MPSPEVTDYPPLLEWLNKHDARCVWFVSDWETGRKNPSRHVEAWMLRGGAIVLVELRADKRGWNLYTAPNTNDIPETFADAEQRCGLDAEGRMKRGFESPKYIPAWAAPNATATQVRDAIIQEVGMMADARTPAMQVAYDAALAREGKVDSSDGPLTEMQAHDRQEILNGELQAKIEDVLQKHGVINDFAQRRIAAEVLTLVGGAR